MGQWWYFLAFWLLPLFTFFQLFLRIRNIAEHAGVKSKNDFNNARTTYANIIERALSIIFAYVVRALLKSFLDFTPACSAIFRILKKS